MSVLRLGASGDEVRQCEAILVQEGYLPQTPDSEDGVFDPVMFDAVVHFQQTHIDSQGHFLDPDGVIGKETHWAFQNPHGTQQRNYFAAMIPDGLGPHRQKVCEVALAEHAAGVKEIPNGSNWGDGVEKLGGWRGAPWCMFFGSWVSKEASGGIYPLEGQKHGSCWKAWHHAEKLGFASATPRPGDIGIMLHRSGGGGFTGKGHAFIVLWISEDGEWISTVEGNCGNRVKIGKRPTSSIHGYINFFRGAERTITNFQRGMVGKTVSGDGTR